MKYWIMKVKTCWITSVILALLSMCPATQARIGFQNRRDADEYAVYSAVINRAVSEAKSKLAVISGRTVFDKEISKAENANALLQMLKPATQRNASGSHPQKCGSSAIVRESEIECALCSVERFRKARFTEQRWQGFHKNVASFSYFQSFQSGVQ